VQRVLQRGGQVKVVFMTSGDGYPEGITRAEHIAQPLPQDYRQYGALRRAEALQALGTFGIQKKNVLFLGFPDRGLCPIFLGHWVDKPPYYRSPYTQQDRPLPETVHLSDTEYDGEDLKKELAHIIVDFRPTLVVSPHPRDQHPDHCATYFFVQEALRTVAAQHPALHPVFLRFLIHFGQWPLDIDAGVGGGTTLTPPLSFPEPNTPWLSLTLTSAEIEAKRQALLQYQSQMVVMGPYLLSFVRANELFSLVPQTSTAETEKQQCCGQPVISQQPRELTPANAS
jgi:LmbE family N-acetylglucosaminyl deacetylase